MCMALQQPSDAEFSRFAERFWAAHSVECALGDTDDADAVLDIALHHYRRIMGAKAVWPKPENLH